MKKRIIQIFKQEGLKVTPESNTRVVHFLDFVLNLDDGLHKPYNKQNANVVYVDKSSNHPPQVLSNIAKGVEQRLSRLSSNETCFNSEVHFYQKALDDAGHKHKLVMQNIHGKTSPNIQNVQLLNDVIFQNDAPLSNIVETEDIQSSTNKRKRKRKIL